MSCFFRLARVISGALRAHRGRILGWNGIFGSIGVGIAPATAGLLTDWIDWRAAFLVPGAVALGMGLALAWFVRQGVVVAAKTDVKPQAEPKRGDVRRAFVGGLRRISRHRLLLGRRRLLCGAARLRQSRRPCAHSRNAEPARVVGDAVARRYRRKRRIP